MLEDIIEDKFGVEALDESYKPTGKRTVVELSDLICKGLRTSGKSADPKKVLFELRELLVHVTGTPPIRVQPETMMSELFDYGWEK